MTDNSGGVGMACFRGAASSGSSSSYAYVKVGTKTNIVKNNLFYNERSGGTGSHYAISDIAFFGLTSNYNLLVSASSSTIGERSGAKTFAKNSILCGLLTERHRMGHTKRKRCEFQLRRGTAWWVR